MLKDLMSFSTAVTPELFAAQMFANTDSKGELWLMDWYDIDCEDCSTYNNFVAAIHWTKHDLLSLVDEYRQLLNHLKIIAQQYDRLDGTQEVATKILPNKQVLHTYVTYVMPFFADTKKERLYEIEKRVGKGSVNYELVGHIQRLCKLLYLGANDLILFNEGRHVIASLALFRFGTKIEKMEDPVPTEIRDLRSRWLSLLHQAEEGEPFNLSDFRIAYEKTCCLLLPHCTKTTIPKDLLSVFSYAYGFGLKDFAPCEKAQKTAQRLTLELLGHFSFGNDSLEEGTTVDKKGNLIPFPFQNFEEAMEIVQRLLESASPCATYQ